VSGVSGGGVSFFKSVLYLPPICVLGSDWCWGCRDALLLYWEAFSEGVDVVTLVLYVDVDGLEAYLF